MYFIVKYFNETFLMKISLMVSIFFFLFRVQTARVMNGDFRNVYLFLDTVSVKDIQFQVKVCFLVLGEPLGLKFTMQRKNSGTG